MQEITGLQNNIVKEVFKLQQKKYRDELILLEGKKSLEGAIEAGLDIKYIFTASHKIYEQFKSEKTYFVTEAIIKKLSTTDSPPEIVAVSKRPIYDINNFSKYKKIILLDGIKDSGNLGTIIRAAAAFGAEGIILYGMTVDAFSPKTIRAAAGNIFKLPIIKANIDELINLKKTHKFIATVVNSDKYPDDFKKSENTVIMFGSEADGLCEELLNITDDKLTLKMSNNVESLNLAVSAGIILYILQN